MKTLMHLFVSGVCGSQLYLLHCYRLFSNSIFFLQLILIDLDKEILTNANLRFNFFHYCGKSAIRKC